MRFVDTNIFLRFLTADPTRGPACRAFFQALDRGDDEVFTSEAVVAEVIYVLTSKKHYGLDRVEAATRLQPTLAVRGLRMTEKSIALNALEIYITHGFLDIEDAISVAHMTAEGIEDIVSYDRGFSRIPGLRRQEPDPL